ncbi:MAG: tripartite tricarboxylate transporter permease, partial [Candidatus Aenigmatarchaeota archaeon]
TGAIKTENAVRGGFTGFMAGTLAGVFPGIGGAISTYILAPVMENNERDFLSAMGAVNTTDALMSFLTLMVLGKARSGSALALQALSSVSYPQAFFLLGCSLAAVAFSAPMSLEVSGTSFIQGIRLEKVALPVLLLVLFLAFILSGPIGLLIMFVSSAVGFAAAVSSQRRMCMAVLVIPAIFSFAGIDIFI